jgi:uncharacterized membrane protein
VVGIHFFPLALMFGFVVAVGVVIAVIVLAVHAATRTASPAGAPPMMGAAPPPARETPMEILARRLASGEITPEEYQRARDLLEGGGKT